MDHVLSDLQELSQTTTMQSIACRQSFPHSSTSMHLMLCYRRWKCIRRSSTSRAEFELWKQCWHAAAEPPKTALDAYAACNASLYPNLSILLQVLVTLPVTFSTLKRLKTYLRSSMRDERLTSLALIHDGSNDASRTCRSR